MRVELLAWVLVGLVVALWLQDRIRKRLFVVFYQFTPKRPGCALRLFWFAMLPGIIVHESSHAATAFLVGSGFPKVSIRPRFDQDGIILGTTTAKRVGPLRRSIVSIAPVVIGSIIILLIGWFIFDFRGLITAIKGGPREQVQESLLSPFNTIWGWIGVYAILMVSINMIPSWQDVKTSGWIALVLAVLFAIFWLLFLTRGNDIGDAAQITNSVLIWLGLSLTLIIVLGLPLLLLLTFSTLR